MIMNGTAEQNPGLLPGGKSTLVPEAFMKILEGAHPQRKFFFPLKCLEYCEPLFLSVYSVPYVTLELIRRNGYTHST